MMVQASSQLQGAPAPTAQAVKRAPKLAVPRHLASIGAGLLGSGALGVPAAGAEPIPYGAPAAAAPALSLPAVQMPDISLPSVSLPAVDIPDVGGLLDGADPLVVGGVVAAVALPAALLALLGGGSSGPKVKGVSAAKALEALAADEYVILLDIRSKADARAAGSPNLKGVSRRGVVSVPYASLVKGEVVVDERFGAKVAKVKGVEAAGAPVILLDTSGSEAAAAAKAILAEVPLERLYFVQGGADAWQASGNPWKEPSAPFSFSLPDIDLASLDLSGATKTIAGGVQTTAAAVTTLASDFESAPASAKGLLAAVGVVGASAFLFSQVELLLELAGLVAAGQFLLKVVFAEDREKTLTEIKKVAEEIDVKDLPEDLGKIAVTLLEDPTAAPAATTKKAAPEPSPVPVVAASGGGEPSSSPAAPEA